MNATLQQLDRGMDVCPFAKDRAISSRVMKTVGHHATEPEDFEPPARWNGAPSHDEESPTSYLRRRKHEQQAALMAIHI